MWWVVGGGLVAVYLVFFLALRNRSGMNAEERDQAIDSWRRQIEPGQPNEPPLNDPRKPKRRTYPPIR